MTTLLALASQDEPVLLVLDDVHWAGKPTLLMLRHLLRSEQQMRVLVVATYRETEVDGSPLGDLLAGVRRDASMYRLSLGGLDRHGVESYLEAAAGHDLDDRARELARALHEETDGNAFFVGELLSNLVESGAIFQEDGRWTSSVSIADLGLPEGVKDVIGRRLARFSGAARKALTVAAVVGPSFSLRLLEAIPDAYEDVDALLDTMDEATSTGIVHETASGEYAFAHALVRQTLLTELTQARTSRMHRRIGDALEQMPGASVESIAFHFLPSTGEGDPRKAPRYALQAGLSATERLAHEEAVQVFEAGLDAQALDADPDRIVRGLLRVE